MYLRHRVYQPREEAGGEPHQQRPRPIFFPAPSRELLLLALGNLVQTAAGRRRSSIVVHGQVRAVIKECCAPLLVLRTWNFLLCEVAPLQHNHPARCCCCTTADIISGSLTAQESIPTGSTVLGIFEALMQQEENLDVPPPLCTTQDALSFLDDVEKLVLATQENVSCLHHPTHAETTVNVATRLGLLWGAVFKGLQLKRCSVNGGDGSSELERQLEETLHRVVATSTQQRTLVAVEFSRGLVHALIADTSQQRFTSCCWSPTITRLLVEACLLTLTVDALNNVSRHHSSACTLPTSSACVGASALRQLLSRADADTSGLVAAHHVLQLSVRAFFQQNDHHNNDDPWLGHVTLLIVVEWFIPFMVKHENDASDSITLEGKHTNAMVMCVPDKRARTRAAMQLVLFSRRPYPGDSGGSRPRDVLEKQLLSWAQSHLNGLRTTLEHAPESVFNFIETTTVLLSTLDRGRDGTSAETEGGLPPQSMVCRVHALLHWVTRLFDYAKALVVQLCSSVVGFEAEVAAISTLTGQLLAAVFPYVSTARLGLSTEGSSSALLSCNWDSGIVAEGHRIGSPSLLVRPRDENSSARTSPLAILQWNDTILRAVVPSVEPRGCPSDSPLATDSSLVYSLLPSAQSGASCPLIYVFAPSTSSEHHKPSTPVIVIRSSLGIHPSSSAPSAAFYTWFWTDDDGGALCSDATWVNTTTSLQQLRCRIAADALWRGCALSAVQRQYHVSEFSLGVDLSCLNWCGSDVTDPSTPPRAVTSTESMAARVKAVCSVVGSGGSRIVSLSTFIGDDMATLHSLYALDAAWALRIAYALAQHDGEKKNIAAPQATERPAESQTTSPPSAVSTHRRFASLYQATLHRTIRSQLHAVFTASVVVTSGVVLNSNSGTMGKVGAAMSSVGSAVPVIGGALSALGAVLQAVDRLSEKQKLENIRSLCVTEVEAAKLFEAIADEIMSAINVSTPETLSKCQGVIDGWVRRCTEALDGAIRMVSGATTTPHQPEPDTIISSSATVDVRDGELPPSPNRNSDSSLTSIQQSQLGTAGSTAHEGNSASQYSDAVFHGSLLASIALEWFASGSHRCESTTRRGRVCRSVDGAHLPRRCAAHVSAAISAMSAEHDCNVSPPAAIPSDEHQGSQSDAAGIPIASTQRVAHHSASCGGGGCCHQ